MRMAAGLAIAVLVGTLGSAARAELDAAETKWLKQCVDAFGAKSARTRDGASAAIAKLGLEAVPGLVAEAARLKTDDQWNALTKSLELMGAKDAANAVDMARDKWPKGMEQRLGALVAMLRSAAPAPAPAPPPAADADVAAKVRELLEPYRTAHRYSMSDPAVARVVELGRAAVPTLIDMLSEFDDAHGPGMLSHATSDALAALANDSDVPVLAQLLNQGRLDVARAFRRLRSPAALDALLDAVGRGFMSWDMVEAIDHFGNDARAGAALVRWLASHSSDSSWKVAPVAEYLGKRRVHGAVDPLLAAAKGPLEPQSANKVGAALAELGRKDGIELLIAVLERKFGAMDSSDDFPRREAGVTLNGIAGRAIYAGEVAMAGGVRDNADEAAKQFHAWWDQVKDKIRFDETRRAWLVD